MENATFAVPSKYLSNFWRSLKMLLINSKIDLKLTRTKYSIFSANENDNSNDNGNNIIFVIKGTKLSVPVVTLSAKDNQKILKDLSKKFEKSIYWNEYKTIGEDKIQQMNIGIFWNKILSELIDYLF